MRNGLFSLLVAVLLGGCSSLTDLKTDISERLFGREVHDPPTELKEIQATVDLKLLWQASVSASPDYDFSPAVDGKFVYAASQNGELIKLDAATGKPVWRVSAGEKLSGGTGAGEKRVLVGTPKGMVLAFDQENGKPLWKAKVASEVLSAPRIYNGVVVVRSGDSRIYGLDAVDGKRKWVYERATPTLTLRSSAGVTIDEAGIAFVGFAGGKLIALNSADGKVLWEASVAQPKGTTEIERIADVTSLPVVDGRYVYASAFNGRTVGIDRASGRVLWNRDISSYVGLAVDGSTLYLTQSNGAVYALDYSSGKSYWRQGGLQWRRTTAPVAVGRYAMLGDLEGYVHLLSKDDGDFVGRLRTDSSSIMPQPVALGPYAALFQTRGGGVYAIGIK
ncbi:MAG: outer membrane protein assembly factor BamB [Methylophilaceae bacterium]|nr:outer membrane protein assembly factor BamB [Methylophilaceae bacterium]